MFKYTYVDLGKGEVVDYLKISVVIVYFRWRLIWNASQLSILPVNIGFLRQVFADVDRSSVDWKECLIQLLKLV